ncbi:MAG: helix-turn-helix domain-containing protein [Caulobacteraceae bacterium]|nr:helix-turn-helix domain-containing protein [Caulobacteraceae bacterium]
MPQTRIEILLYADCLGSEAFAVFDTLMLARQLGLCPGLEARLVSVGARPVSVGGTLITPARASQRPDMLIVPGMTAQDSAGLIARCGGLDAEQVHIARVHRLGGRIGAICVGVFLAAAAGVLNGRRVTTAWPVAEALQHWQPGLEVARAHMVLADGPVITTGAMSAAYDLALALVEEASGPGAALRLRKLLALDGDRTSQLRFETALIGAGQNDVLVQRAKRVMLETLAEGLDLPTLAERCGTSERTLLRRFKAVTGETLLAYRHRLVVDAVKALLEQTVLPFPHIPARVGYADEVSLRRLFRNATAMTFRDYRRRFGVLPAHRNG